MLGRLKVMLAAASVPVWTVAFVSQNYDPNLLLVSSLVLSSSVLAYTARQKR